MSLTHSARTNEHTAEDFHSRLTQGTVRAIPPIGVTPLNIPLMTIEEFLTALQRSAYYGRHTVKALSEHGLFIEQLAQFRLKHPELYTEFINWILYAGVQSLEQMMGKTLEFFERNNGDNPAYQILHFAIKLKAVRKLDKQESIILTKKQRLDALNLEAQHLADEMQNLSSDNSATRQIEIEARHKNLTSRDPLSPGEIVRLQTEIEKFQRESKASEALFKQRLRYLGKQSASYLFTYGNRVAKDPHLFDNPEKVIRDAYANALNHAHVVDAVAFIRETKLFQLPVILSAMQGAPIEAFIKRIRHRTVQFVFQEIQQRQIQLGK